MQINIVYIDGRTARVPCTKWQPIQIENTVAYYNRLEEVYRAYVTNRQGESMKQGNRVYRSGAPYFGIGTVIWVMGDLITVRWDMKGDIRNHRASALRLSGQPV